jgi:hypothetical protein
MSYIFDPDKRDNDEFITTLNASGSELVEIEADGQVTETFTIGQGIPKYVFPSSRSMLSNRILVDPGTGILEWKNVNSIAVATFAFKKLIDSNVTYTLLLEDYIVEVESPTYTSLFLPPSIGNGGKTYILSQGFNPITYHRVIIYPNGTDTIDGSLSYGFRTENDRLNIYSNDEGSWYIF